MAESEKDIVSKRETEILSKMVLTRSERAFEGLPSSHHLHHGYISCATPGEYSDPEVTPKLVAIGVTTLSTKEGFQQPARVTVVNKTLKYIVREKIKVEGHVQNYNSGETGLDAHALADVTSTKAEITKKISRIIDSRTVIISFDPAQDLHSLKLISSRVIDVRQLFKQDLELGLSIDQDSLVKRYLHPAQQKLPSAVQAMMLALLFYSAHAWTKNVQEQANFPLFPITPHPENISKHCSKQGLIDEVHKTLMWRYRSRLIRPPTPVLIGQHVIRVHVKKWDQLQRIPDFMRMLGPHLKQQEAEEEEQLANSADIAVDSVEDVKDQHLSFKEDMQDDFRLISLPISMKTKSQKKGFFVYLDFDSVERAKKAEEYFSSGRDGTGFKCEQAIPRAAATPSGTSTNKHTSELPTQTFNVIRD